MKMQYTMGNPNQKRTVPPCIFPYITARLESPDRPAKSRYSLAKCWNRKTPPLHGAHPKRTLARRKFYTVYDRGQFDFQTENLSRRFHSVNTEKFERVFLLEFGWYTGKSDTP